MKKIHSRMYIIEVGGCIRNDFARWRGNVRTWIFCIGVIQDRGITMPTSISKIKLINFKRFRNYVIEPNNRINILVGDNEVGKSSVLEAIDLVASGNVRRVEAMGLDRLININAIELFNEGARSFDLENELKRLKEVIEAIDYKIWYYETANNAGTLLVHETMSQEEIPKDMKSIRARMVNVKRITE